MTAMIFSNSKQKFYLITVDLLQGIIIIPMIFIHGILWYNAQLALNYENESIFIFIIVFLGLLVFPCFVFLNGFNQINSYQKRPYLTWKNVFKRFYVFFGIATLAQSVVFISNSLSQPERLLNYLVTWNFFHIFAFSTLYISILWQLAFKFTVGKEEKFRIVLISLLMFSITIVSVLFLLYYEYALARVIPTPVPLNLAVILEYAFLDVRSVGIIPWILFSLVGALFAIILSLPNATDSRTTEKLLDFLGVGSLLVLLGGFILLIIGSRFTSPIIDLPSSFSHIFISNGILGASLVLGLRRIDLKKPQHINTPCIMCNLGKIGLTVYVLHNLLFFLDPLLIPSLPLFFLSMSLYSLLFLIIAYYWQRWNFKFSLEWFIYKLTR